MKQTQLHDAIIELVKKQGYVSTEELVEQFAVSPQTIRRDLNDLADQNRILRHHGGAALPSSSPRFFRAPDHAAMVASGLVDTFSPLRQR